MNDAVRYHNQDRRRDPTQVRTEWILQQLLRRPQRADEIERLAEGNGLGYRPATYARDLRGLVARRLVNPPVQLGGAYTIDPRDGYIYAQTKGLI